jgi:predicted enzyme related to lactoylglutathione lyase
VVIDVKDFGLMKSFWQRALGYEERRSADPGDESPSAILNDPRGRGPNVTIDRMDPYRNAIHIDLYSENFDGDVRRLTALGATIYREREQEDDFVVMADPEGNLFCVVDAGP